MIQVIEVQNRNHLQAFVEFPIHLFKHHVAFVPPLIREELQFFSDDNPAFADCKKKLLLFKKDGKWVGRVALIINPVENEVLGKKTLRFGWIDAIEDEEVFHKILNEARAYAKENVLDTIEGPMGFTNMEKAGMLTEGFDQLATFIGIYNPPYYPQFMRKLGGMDGKKWVEFKLSLPDSMPEKLYKFSDVLQERLSIKKLIFSSKKQMLSRAEEVFHLLEKSYSQLPSFVPFTQRQKKYYIQKYFSLLNKDLVFCLENKEGEIIAFAICIPSLSNALKKANGRLFPLGWWYLWRAFHNNPDLDFYLIGVDPDYQRKGVTAIIFTHMYEVFKRKGFIRFETNPQLEENKAVHAIFKDYNPVLHKRRQTFIFEV